MKGRIVATDKSNVLFEWTDDNNMPQRHWLPDSEIVVDEQGEPSTENPKAGVPFGFDWKKHVGNLKVTGADFQRALRERGFWTAEDAKSNWAGLVGALQAAYGYSLSQFLESLPKSE